MKLIALHECVEEVMFGSWMWKGWLDCGGGGTERAREKGGDGKLLQLTLLTNVMAIFN